jgi:hypothetical protein
MINESAINLFTRTSSHVLPLCGVKVDDARRVYVDRQRVAAQARNRMATAASRTPSPILVGGVHDRRQMADSTSEYTMSNILLTEKLRLLEEEKVIAKKLKAVEDQLNANARIMKLPASSPPTAGIIPVDRLGGNFRPKRMRMRKPSKGAGDGSGKLRQKRAAS